MSPDIGRVDRVDRVGRDGLTPGQPTAGMRREAAVVLPELWTGLVHTDPQVVGGWHHHGAHQSVLYVVAGVLRLETGEQPGGTTVDGHPGDFLHIPPYVVHREGNPTDETSTAVVIRQGTGEVVVNVDGPGDPAATRT